VDRPASLGAVTRGLLAAPLLAEAQPPAKVFRIGLLGWFPADQPGGLARLGRRSPKDTSRARTPSSRADGTGIRSNDFPAWRPS
jgi:hypothetical protein